MREQLFGRNLVHLRFQANLTQEQLCEKANIDRSYLQRMERASSNPTLKVLARLKNALGCSWDVLLRGIEEIET